MCDETAEMVQRAYEIGYCAGYAEGCKIREQERGKQWIKVYERRLYFITQKEMGESLLVITALLVKASDGDTTVTLLTVPISSALIFSKRMLVVNKYYWKCKGEKL